MIVAAKNCHRFSNLLSGLAADFLFIGNWAAFSLVKQFHFTAHFEVWLT
jgi:hypothetical protein